MTPLLRKACKELVYPWRPIHHCSGKPVFELVSDDDDDVKQPQAVRSHAATYIDVQAL